MKYRANVTYLPAKFFYGLLNCTNVVKVVDTSSFDTTEVWMEFSSEHDAMFWEEQNEFYRSRLFS